jgi:hypothetical protein
MTVFFAEINSNIFTAIVFQKVNQSLNVVPFVKVTIGCCTFYPGSAPESPGCRVLSFKVKIRPGQMKIAISTDDFLMFPQTVPAASADLRENEAYEIVNQGHVLVVRLSGC